MASSRTLTEAYRKGQLAVRARTIRDFLKLWPLLNPEQLNATAPGWLAAVQALVERDRQVSSGLSAAYLRTFKAQTVGGEAVIALALPLEPAAFATSMSVTGLLPIQKALRRGTPMGRAREFALTSSSGTATRYVLNAGRETINQSLAADPDGKGYRRAVSGKACAFCRDKAAGGVVFSTATVFPSHDHCACSPTPYYRKT